MWFRTLFDSRTPAQRARRNPPRRRPAACRLAVEALDDRRVPASLSVSDVSVVEGNAGTRNALVTVSLSGSSNPPVTVGYSTANGTARAGSDYQAVSGTLTFEKGATNKSILVPIIGDLVSEPNETLFVNLKNAKHATIADGQAVVTILDDDTRINVGDVTVQEGDSGTTDFAFTVSLSAASGQPVTVSYATADGTATGGSDYVPASGSLTIPAGQTTRTVTVPVNGDRLSEADETFFVNLSNPTNALIADGQGVGTIADNEPRVRVSDATLLEGDSGTAAMSFDVSLQAAYDLPVTVNYATADDTATAGEDYAAASGTLTFLPGQTVQSVAVAVTGDRLSEQDETFLVNLSTPDSYTTLARDVGVGLINDNEPHVTIYDAWQDYYGTSITFTVSLAVPYDQAVTVDFNTLDGSAFAGVDYVATSGTLTFNPGETTATFTVELLTFDPGAYRYFNVQLSNPSSNASLVNDWAYGFWFDDSF